MRQELNCNTQFCSEAYSVSSNLWFQIPIALVMGFMIWRMYPVAMHWVKNGPKGSSKEWLNVSMLLAAVVLFVTFLIVVVRG